MQSPASHFFLSVLLLFSTVEISHQGLVLLAFLVEELWTIFQSFLWSYCQGNVVKMQIIVEGGLAALAIVEGALAIVEEGLAIWSVVIPLYTVPVLGN